MQDIHYQTQRVRSELDENGWRRPPGDCPRATQPPRVSQLSANYQKKKRVGGKFCLQWRERSRPPCTY